MTHTKPQPCPCASSALCWPNPVPQPHIKATSMPQRSPWHHSPAHTQSWKEEPVPWLAGRREGWWLSLQFPWKCLHGIRYIHFSSKVFPSGKRQGGIRLNFVSVLENITLLCVSSNLRSQDNSAENYYYYDRRHFYF